MVPYVIFEWFLMYKNLIWFTTLGLSLLQPLILAEPAVCRVVVNNQDSLPNLCIGKFDSERVLRKKFLYKPDQQICKMIKNPIIEISSLTSLCINHDQSTHKKSPFALPYAYPIVLQYSVTYAACCYAIVQHIVLFYTQTRVSLREAFMVRHLRNPLKMPIWLDHPKDGKHWNEA